MEERKRNLKGELVPRSTKELIALYSTARVLAPSHKVKILGFHPVTGQPILSRRMTDEDVKHQMINRYK